MSGREGHQGQGEDQNWEHDDHDGMRDVDRDSGQGRSDKVKEWENERSQWQRIYTIWLAKTAGN